MAAAIRACEGDGAERSRFFARYSLRLSLCSETAESSDRVGARRRAAVRPIFHARPSAGRQIIRNSILGSSGPILWFMPFAGRNGVLSMLAARISVNLKFTQSRRGKVMLVHRRTWAERSKSSDAKKQRFELVTEPAKTCWEVANYRTLVECGRSFLTAKFEEILKCRLGAGLPWKGDRKCRCTRRRQTARNVIFRRWHQMKIRSVILKVTRDRFVRRRFAVLQHRRP